MDKPVITVAHDAPAAVPASAIAFPRPDGIFTIPAASVREARLLTRIVGGAVVYRRNP
jgi:hypothetical protein